MNGWLNGVLRRFHYYLRYITATAHIIHTFLGSPVLGFGSEVSCPRKFSRKTHRIQCCSNPGPLDYESNTLPLLHAGPLLYMNKTNKHYIYILFNKRMNHEIAWSLDAQEIQQKAKGIDTGQPAQSAQADPCRYFLQMVLNPFFTEDCSALSLPNE